MIETLDGVAHLVWSAVLFLSIQGALAGIAALVFARLCRRFSPLERSVVLLCGLGAFVVPIRVLVPASAAPQAVELVHPSVGGLDGISLALAAVYLGGVAIALAALARQRGELARVLRAATPLSTRCHPDPPVVVSDEVAVPFAARPLAPIVVLPGALVRSMTPERIEHIVRHEQAHIRHGDLWVNLLVALVRAMFWFHPVARWLAREIVAVREELSDDAVIRAGCKPASYGSTLVRTAELVSASPVTCRVAFLGGEFDQLAARLRRLGEGESSPTLRFWRRFTVLLTCAVVAGLVMIAVPDLRIHTEAGSHRDSHRALHHATHHHG